MTPLPEGFLPLVAPLLGDSLPAFLAAYDEAPARGLRMNARKPLPPPAGALAPVPFAPGAFYIPADSALGAHPLHEAGAYYLQEPSAMAAAAALDARPGERVLDLCAAPGGKSTQLAAALGGRGVLVCNEPSPARAQVLSRNLERMGVENALVLCAQPDALAARMGAWFDRVLVDAPCSGEGMFRRHPETRGAWNPQAPAGCAARQRAILRAAARMVRPGGYLAYSTCTFNALENEGVINAFLREFSDFSPAPFALPGLPAAENGMLRLWPHEFCGEGHFVARLRRAGDAPAPPAHARPFPAPDPKTAALAAAFLDDAIADPPAPNALFAGRVVCVPEALPPLAGIRVLRAGLHVGQARGALFVPDHALAMARLARRTLPVDETQAARYLHGETLPAPDALRGWAAPTLRGLPLGFGKASQGQLKNHYPKGLRR